MCHFENGEKYGMLLRSEAACEEAAAQIAGSWARLAGSKTYAYRFRCDDPGLEGAWIDVTVGELRDGQPLLPAKRG